MSTEPKMTPWFTGQPPAHHGPYQVSETCEEDDFEYAYWGPRGWGVGNSEVSAAVYEADDGAEADFFHKDGWHWRGLAEKPA